MKKVYMKNKQLFVGRIIFCRIKIYVKYIFANMFITYKGNIFELYDYPSIIYVKYITYFFHIFWIYDHFCVGNMEMR